MGVFRFTTACGLLLALICLSACGGGKQQAMLPATGADESTTGGTCELPGLREATHIPIAYDATRELTGSEFSTEEWLPRSRVVALGQGAVFYPRWDPAKGLSSAALATYALRAAMPGDRLELMLEFSEHHDWEDVSVAVTNHARQCWEWHAVPEDGVVLLEHAQELLDDEAIGVVVAITGSRQWVLQRIRIADDEDGRVALSLTPEQGNEPQDVIMVAALADDAPPATRYDWNLYDEALIQSSFDSTILPAHLMTATQTGEHLVRVRVTFEDGSQSIASRKLTIRDSTYYELKLDPTDPDCLGVPGSGTRADPYWLRPASEAATFTFAVHDPLSGAKLPRSDFDWTVGTEWSTPIYEPPIAEWFGSGKLSVLGDGLCAVRAAESAERKSQILYARVRPAPVDLPPIAQFTATPLLGPAPLIVEFDPSGSRDQDTADPQGLAKVEWDVNGDGIFDFGRGNSVLPLTYTYDQPGVHLVTLRVTEYDGGSAEAQMLVAAQGDPAAPYWHFNATSLAGVPYSVALTEVDGFPAVCFSDLSQILYQSAQDALGETWDTPQVVYEGDQYSTLACRDLAVVGGRPALLATEPTYSGTQLLHVPAADSAGASWLDAASIATSSAHIHWAYLAEVEARAAVGYCMGFGASAWIGFVTNTGSIDLPDWTSPVYAEQLTSYSDCGGLINCAGHPALCYLRDMSHGAYPQTGRLVFNRAADSSGTDWSESQEPLGEAAGIPCALVSIGGFPVLAWIDQSSHAVMYMSAADAEGSTWNAPAVAIDAPGAPHAREIEIIEVDAAPVLIITRGSYPSLLSIVRAQDAGGASWDPAETFWGCEQILSIDAAVIDGRPTVAVASIMTGGDYRIWVGVYD